MFRVIAVSQSYDFEVADTTENFTILPGIKTRSLELHIVTRNEIRFYKNRRKPVRFEAARPTYEQEAIT